MIMFIYIANCCISTDLSVIERAAPHKTVASPLQLGTYNKGGYRQLEKSCKPGIFFCHGHVCLSSRQLVRQFALKLKGVKM